MSFANPLNLNTLSAAQGFRIDGAAAGDFAGSGISSVGDLNGDGFVDFAIGARSASTNGRTSNGAAYVVFGQASGFADIDLAALGTKGFRIDGQADSDFAGSSLAAAGDINGDGFDDLILGVTFADNNGRASSGSAYVLFGTASGFSGVDLASLGTQGFRIDGAMASDAIGISVAAAGDVNGDGLGDILVGADRTINGGGVRSGSAYVVFGKASGFADVDLAALGTQGFRMDGLALNDLTGFSTDAAGDINGDGFVDLVVGARTAGNNGRANSGSAYVVFGKASGFGNLDLAALGTEGFRIDGAAAGDQAGWSVASAGDVNGDGFTDLVVGAPLAGSNGRVDSGSAYVLFGKAAGFANVDLGALGTQGFRIDGPTAGDKAGYSVASAGDVNGDGFADLAIGAPDTDGIERDSGAAYVVLGKASGFANIDLASLGAQGFRIVGQATGDRLGIAVSPGMDFDSDGFSDLLLSASGASNNGRSRSGSGYLLFSQSTGHVNLRGTTLADSLGGGAGNDQLFGFAGSDRLNGRDGDDTLTGGSGNDRLEGGAGDDTINGGAGVDSVVFTATLAASTVTKNAGAGWTVTGPDGSDQVTSIERLVFADGTMSTARVRPDDLTGRAFADLLWRATDGGWLYLWQLEGAASVARGGFPGGPDATRSLVGRGDLDGNGRADLVWQDASGNLSGQLLGGTEGAIGTLTAGQVLAGMGDTDGDGKADLVLIHAGAVTIRRMDGTATLSTTATTFNSQAMAALGSDWSVAAVADFNADLKADILWRNATTGDLYVWQMNGAAVSAQAALAGPGAGWSVLGAGDLNGDGRADVVLRQASSGDVWGLIVDAGGTGVASAGFIGRGGAGWTAARVTDATGDDRADILWTDAANNVLLWQMDGLTLSAQTGAGTGGTAWTLL